MLKVEKPEFVPEIEEGSVIQEVQNQNHYVYRGMKIPKHFGWWIVLMELSRMRNVELEIIYPRGIKKRKPDMFTIDEENGVAPQMPLIVNVYKVRRKRIRHDYEHLFGRSYKKVKEKVVTIRNLKGLDPNPWESLNMIKAML